MSIYIFTTKIYFLINLFINLFICIMDMNVDINDSLLVYNIDIDKHKNKIIDEMTKDINFIYSIIDAKCVDILIKIFIMYKREKKKKIKLLYEPYIKLILKLNKLEYVDINEYFLIIVKILYIIKMRDKIDTHVNSYVNNNNNIVDIEYLNNIFDTIINKFAKDNSIINKLVEIQKYKNNTDTIIQLSILMSKELHAIYNPYTLYKLLSTIINIDNNKHKFIKTYKETCEKILYIYENDDMVIKKKKLNCNKNIINNLLKKVKDIINNGRVPTSNKQKSSSKIIII